MVRSMTGFGKTVVEVGELTIFIEMKAVNHRFLDISFKMPRHLFTIEDLMRRMLKKTIERGKIEVFIKLLGEGQVERNLKVDWQLLEQYMNKLTDIQATYALKGEIAVDSLLQITDIFEVEEREAIDDALKEVVLTGLGDAIQELERMRDEEGQFLLEDIINRLDKMSQLLKQIEEIHPVVAKSYQERLQKRLKAYIDDPAEIDEVRLHQEIAILIEKGDITEEIVRLKSHIHHMEKTFQEGRSIGRKLDFICQEMHREANTIGSKSTDSKLNELNVLLKNEIEKIKEQVQNIE